MEFRARYVLIGLFTLGVISAVFTFVYWLNNVGGFQERDYYKVRFESSVSGLVRGSAVMFNGIRIGEVTELNLDFNQPKQLFATIGIQKGTPIRQDTLIGVEYQGLTGSAAITLTGQGNTAPIIKKSNNEVPVLVADAMAGMSWTQSARDVLAQMHSILAENKEPLNNSLKNIDKFTDALAKNSGKVEGILAGLERMTGGKDEKDKGVIYDLEAPKTFPSDLKKGTWQLVINEPTVLLALNTDKVMMQTKPGERTALGQGRWSDNLPNFFQTKILQSFENAGYAGSVAKPSAGAASDYQLVIDIRTFQLAAETTPKAEIEFVARLIDKEGKILGTQNFKASEPAQAIEPSAATAALGAAFKKCATDLVKWAVSAI